MLPIAVDAMGGDHAPGAIVAGARAAAAEGTPIVLVGPPTSESASTSATSPLIEACEVIEMDEDGGRAVRRKKDSTLVRAAEAVRDGQASAMISAGNTGATMASALLRMGRIKGVNRPAIATHHPGARRPARRCCSTPAPTPRCSPTGSCSSPRWARSSPATGSASTRPKVGLLSIGEEPGKGDALRKEAYELLTAAADATRDLDFIGNVEGRDVMSDDGRRDRHRRVHRQRRAEDARGRPARRSSTRLLGAFGSTPEYQQHADALMPAMLPLYDTLDPETYGGAMLLGVDGVCIISHGSSSERAIFNAINVAREMVEADVVGEISRAISPPPV